ncbi:MAG: peptidase M23, partial [Halothiobacillaceae bacterium]
MKKYSLINQDYRFVTHRGTAKALPFQKRHALLVGSLLLIALAVIIALPHDASATRSEPLSAAEPPSVPVSPSVSEPTPGSLTAAQPTQIPNAETEVSTETEWRPLTVVRGDNLETLFNRAGLNVGQANEFVALNATARKLTKLFPGDVVNVRSSEGLITHLTFETSETEQLQIVRRSDGQLSATVVTLPTEKRISYATATVENSLFLAAQNAGVSDKLILDLANIFAWDIDFALDLRPGDQFTIAYETIYRDGKKLRDGAIVAAEFTNNGATYTAIQFTSGGAPQYYSPNGVSLRKSFLRAPVEFTRISSKFGSSRYHPILNRI